jgi:DNA-binding NarL/FixJ family response regulator
MAKSKRNKVSDGLGDVALQVRASAEALEASDTLLTRKRQMLAEFCRLIAQAPDRAASVQQAARGAEVDALPPRLRQTLAALLNGDSEKQVARQLKLSRHTVHVYVKSLYRRFNVTSRGELLARWVHRDAPGPLTASVGRDGNS